MNNQPQDPTVTQNLAMLDSMKTAHDAGFNTQISNIQSQYNQLIQLQSVANSSAQGQEQSFLLRNGAARNETGANAMHAVITGQINNLGMLQAKENDAIAKVQTAMSNSDYRDAQAQQKILDKVTSDKKALAEKITSSIVSQNAKLNTAKVQSTKDNAIAEIFSSGVTDPKDILAKVDPNLGVTLKDINSALTTFSGGDIRGLTGNVKNFYALKQAGALPGDISKLPDNEQLKAYLGMEKTIKSTADATTKPIYTTADNQPVTKSNLATMRTNLESSRVNGYVPDDAYQQLFTWWTSQGLSDSSFEKEFPSKYYINPANSTLPGYLKPTQPKSSTSAVDKLIQSLGGSSSTATTTPST